MVCTSTRVRILCVVVLMLCCGGESGRAGAVPPLIISEFRLRGPAGATDEFIEVLNESVGPHTVRGLSGTGYGIAASDGVTRCTIPDGTVIPSRGHFLCVNSNGYSLGGVPAGSGSTATGDATYALDIPDNAGIALFNNNSGGASYSMENRADAVGSTSETNTLYKEGAGYLPWPLPLPREGAWVRLTPGSCARGTCTPQSRPPATFGLVDSNDNNNDFYYTDTTGGISIPDGRVQRLGAPGPQALSSPAYEWGGEVTPARVSGCSSSDMAPNRIRDVTPGPALTSPLGTLDLRVKWLNRSSVPVTRLRFRVVDLTIWPVPFGTADLRVLSADPRTVTVDNYPCGTPDGGDLLAATTLDQPAQSNGGGLNSGLSVNAVTPAMPFDSGGHLSVRLRLGVAQEGFARFCVIPETTPVLPVDPWCYIGSTQVLPDLPTPGDYDFDGAADMVTQDPARQWWTVQKSSGGYTGPAAIFGFGYNGAPVPGDYDGDGRYDLAIYQAATGTWIAILSRTNGFRTYEGYGGAGFDPVPGDYDGDGTTDLAVWSATRHVWRFWPSSSTTSLMVERDFGETGETPVGGQDFDGDGVSDMTLFNARTGVWRHRTSSSNFTGTVSQWWTFPGATLVPGDYDGDLRADYGVYERATGTWHILVSSGVTPYSSQLSGTWGGLGFVPVPADYDGDGRLDIAVYQGATLTWLALKSSTLYTTPLTATFGTTSDRVIGRAVLPAVSRETHAGDFDGDAASDIVVYDTASGIWSRKESADGFMATLTRSHGGTGFTAVPGDYDGDGRGDIGFYQPSIGRWQVRRSQGAFETIFDFSAGGPEWVPVAGDYDGDARADMIVYNTATGQWYGRTSSGNFASPAPLSAVTWGGPGYEPAPGDFDGDGRLDMCVYQPATGIWWILTSRSGYTSGPGPRYYGGPGFVPVPADFDGDGVTDVAVHNPATGVWAFLRSDTGNALGYSQGNGGTGYTPVAGDWDGDRRADLAVYQAATASWAILKSSAGFTASLPPVMLGGAGQIPLPMFR